MKILSFYAWSKTLNGVESHRNDRRNRKTKANSEEKIGLMNFLEYNPDPIMEIVDISENSDLDDEDYSSIIKQWKKENNL